MMKFRILLIFIAFSMTNIAFGQASNEVDLTVATINEKKIEDQLIEGNEELKKCKEANKDKVSVNDRNDANDKCIADIISKVDEEELKEFSKKSKLGAYDKEASQSSTTIREYLSKRMTSALRGTGDKELSKAKLKEMKFVDHGMYSKLYRSQIGKNILLETSNYCLVNLGVASAPKQLISHCTLGESCNFPKSKVENTINIIPANKAIEISYDKSNKKYTAVGLSSATYTEFWRDHAWEYKTCDTQDCIDKQPSDSRTTGLIKKFRDVEFQLGAEYLKKKVGFCTQIAIKTMCERYRCINTYPNTPNTPKDKVEACKNDLKIDITDLSAIKTKEQKEQGIMACGIMERLHEYRKVIAALDAIDKNSKNDSAKGYKVNTTFKGQYGTGKNEKSIEEITTVASNEFDDIQFSDSDDLDQLKEECIVNGEFKEGDKKCDALVSNSLDDGQATALSAEHEAETQAYLKRVELLEKEGRDSLKKFMEEKGLGKLYNDNLSEQELASILTSDYKSRRDALKQTMMDKYNKAKTKAITDSTADADKAKADNSIELAKLAESNIADMQNEKEKLQTLVQYTNVLSSYLGASKGDGEDREDTTLSYQRQIEFDNSKDTVGGDISKDEAEDFFGVSDQSSEQTNLQVDVDFIDSLLGNTSDTEDEKAKLNNN